MQRLCGFLVTLVYYLGLVTTNPAPESATSHVANSEVTNEVASADQSNATREEGDGIADEGWEYENKTIVDTRRILYSKTVAPGKRPYMVYLQLTKESAKAHKYRGWLCGGVIVHKYYVLTSAACVEDADRFYVVSGTTKFVDSFDYKTNDCVCKHRRRVVWKCIPKNYKFDFQDSLKWSSNDIAIVKVDKPFKIGASEKGCEFAANILSYNNISRDLEKPGTKGYIAGWGSGSNFREGVYRSAAVHVPNNAKQLQEAKVCVMDNEQCAKKWAQKFRSIITQYMICTKDVMKRLSEVCDKKYANCTDVESRRDDSDRDGESTILDLGRHFRDPDDYSARRSSLQGGFCENDHGGPLIVKYQNKERVIGVISACKIDPKSHSCHGPFLYTSIFKNRQFISCSINKDIEEEGENCRRVFRTGITHEEFQVNWDDYKEDDEEDRDDKDSDSDSDNNGELRKQRKDKKKVIKIESAASSSESEEDRDGLRKPREEKVISGKKKRGDESEGIKSERSKKRSKKHVSSKKGGGEEKRNSQGAAEDEGVFYESSRDENVNDPGHDE